MIEFWITWKQVMQSFLNRAKFKNWVEYSINWFEKGDYIFWSGNYIKKRYKENE